MFFFGGSLDHNHNNIIHVNNHVMMMSVIMMIMIAHAIVVVSAASPALSDSSSLSGPQFTYGTIADNYFQANKRGLTASIENARRNGCLSECPPELQTVRVIFHRDDEVKATSSNVQNAWYNMEILTSAWLGHDVRQRMRKATALWDFSPHNCNYWRKELQVPCEVLPLSATDPPDVVNTWHESTGVPRGSVMTREDASELVHRRPIDAVFFGNMGHPQRRRTCNELTRAPGVRIECHGALWGAALVAKIREAKLVFVDYFYDECPLLTHRVNQVLRQGVPVLMPHSADAELDREYASLGVMFTNAAAPEGRLTRGQLRPSDVTSILQANNRNRIVDATLATQNYIGPERTSAISNTTCAVLRSLCASARDPETTLIPLRAPAHHPLPRKYESHHYHPSVRARAKSARAQLAALRARHRRVPSHAA